MWSFNMLFNCQTCHSSFTTPYSLKRHVINIHKNDGHAPPSMEYRPVSDTRPTGEPTPPLMTNVESSPLVHPFTMMVCGPTGSGKTVWLQKLLACNKIDPPIRRIVWCYGQWQQAYEDMSRTMSNIEFVRGIPDDLEQDSYFDRFTNNLIVLDDLMTAAKNDHRVADLFTKGSHHRSLSTIYVVQNLFAQGKASRDVALNCQYMVLFNSPVDRHQISLLARRMYPRNPDRMLKRYEESCSRPYGYMMIDFKPGTLESQRLKTDILSKHPDPPSKHEDVRGETSRSGSQERRNVIRASIDSDTDDDEDSYVNMPTCEDCGLVFGTIYDLRRHIKMWCVGENDEPPKKKTKTDHAESDISDIAKNPTFQYLYYKAKDHNKPLWSDKFQKYVDKDEMETDLATRKADDKIKPEDKREFFKRYVQLLKMTKHLHTCAAHKRIVDDMMVLHNKGDEKASSNVLRAYKHLFEGLFDQEDSDDDSDDPEDASDQDDD